MKHMKYMIALLACAGIANASIISVSSVSSSGTADLTGIGGAELTHLIDGSGLSGALVDDGTTGGGVTHTTSNLGHLWTTTDPGGSSADYFAVELGTKQLDFDLGGANDVTTAYLYGYYFFGDGNSATSIDVSYSTDGSTFVGSDNLALALPVDSGAEAAQVFNLSSAVAGTTHVRLTFLDNGFGIAAVGGGDRIGLGEVAFGTIPEPATLGLVSVFGGAVLFLRRKLMI